MKILLVDDECDFVAALAERLSIRGIATDYCCTPRDAIHMVENNRYDLAILDMKMPELSGLELREAMHQRAPEMKFIFCTGHGSKEDYEKGSAFACSYLSKPMDIDILMAQIKAAVEEE